LQDDCGSVSSMRWAERDGSEMKRSMDSGKVMSRIGEVNLEKVESEKKNEENPCELEKTFETERVHLGHAANES